MAEYRIDELARKAGATARNIRAYQDRGLLPPPRRAGRVGLYDDAHLARLRLIGQLLQRGYTIANIAELLSGWEKGRDIAAVLGLEQAVNDPWSDEVPAFMPAAELAKLFGETDAAGLDAKAVGRATELGYLVPEGDGFRVPSMRLLHAGAELVRAGIPLAAVLEHAAQLHADVDRIAQRFVALFADHVWSAYGTDDVPSEDLPRLAEMVRRLRPLAEMGVDAELAAAMERHATGLLSEQLAELLRQDGRTALGR